MGADVAAQSTAAMDVYRRADDVVGFGLSQLCFQGPAEQLNATDVQQPAIFVTSVAIHAAAVEAGMFDAGFFSAAGGLSLGEYTALHLAGSLSFDDALRLVQRRGQLMQQACEKHPGGMVSLMGMDEPAVLRLCESVRSHGEIGPANFNCPGQIVVSGAVPACEAAAAAAESFGGKAIPLRVAGAFHSALMRPAADEFAAALASAAFSAPRVPVVANVDAGYHGSVESIRDSLLRQVYSPVRWQGCVERLIADGCDEFWEIGPNRVLSGLMRKIDRRAKTINLSTAADIRPAVET